jgi:hypothetical protein
VGSFGYCHSYETSSRYDGPGLRIVIFTSGCLLRCTYCHNPDTWHLKDGTYVSVDHVLRRLGDFAPTIRSLGGGLTISGGEPMVQLAFTRKIFAGAKEMGLHTAIQTSGFLADRADDSYLSVIDHVLLDIKSSDPATYRRVGLGAHPALRGTPCFDIKAGMGPLHARSRRYRRSGECRRHCPLCRAHEERGMGRSAAVPSDGRLQVDGDGPRLQAYRHSGTEPGTGQSGYWTIPSRGLSRTLVTGIRTEEI